MERLWSLFSHWRSNGDCYQQDPPVLYLCIPSYYGITDHYLHDPRFLEEYAALYDGGEKESVVLFVVLSAKC